MAEPDLTRPPPGSSPWRANLDVTLTAAHDHAVACGQDGYLDPASGLFVFTEAYLFGKGPCCQSRCRHCPYQEWANA